MEIEQPLYSFLGEKSMRLGCLCHGIGGIEDHIHVALTIPPSDSISTVIGKLKGSSSHFLNKELQITEDFSWQQGFGILSFAERDLSFVLGYINNQKEHHRANTLYPALEQIIADSTTVNGITEHRTRPEER
jgi:putative transposase